MDIKIISEKENPLLKRREVLASIDYQGGPTPSKADLQKTLADHFKVNINNVEISKIMSEIGISKGKIWIKIWQEKNVPIYAEIKKEKEKEEPKEEKREEVPKEEKSVEKPEAPKPETESKEKIEPEKPAVEKEETRPETPKEEKKE